MESELLILNSNVESVRKKLQSMDDGEISISAYDTAWVGRIPAIDGSHGPQFPCTIQWILSNQNKDGSWGEESYFCAYDRTLCTVSCLVTLKTWNVGEENVNRGINFLSDNMHKLEDQPIAHMPCGFEIVFLPLLQDAQRLGLDLSCNASYATSVDFIRKEKLRRIPLELLHTETTTLLYSLEGLGDIVDWKRIIKLQSKNGSFLGSPAATACAFMHTAHAKCFEYLTFTLAFFNNKGVPQIHPVDIFERLWLLDTIERLGISHFFPHEIKTILDYVHRHWTSQGIAWSTYDAVADIDNMSMGFRLLRLHGYDIAADAFKHFQRQGKFSCLSNENNHGVTDMFDLYRASQVRFRSETVLEEAETYTRSYLEKQLEQGDCLDKWALKKNFRGEVLHALAYPFYRTYPRIEARTYLEQYGTSDVWIGKVLYRLPSINNEILLDIAKLDFDICRKLHTEEMQEIRRWWESSGFVDFSLSRHIEPHEVYFSIGASIFESEFQMLRISYTKVACLTAIMEALFNNGNAALQDLSLLQKAIKRWDPYAVRNMAESHDIRKLFTGIYETTNEIIESASQRQGRCVGDYIRSAWRTYASNGFQEREIKRSGNVLQRQAAENQSRIGCLLLSCVFLCGEVVKEEMLQQFVDGSNLLRLVSEACCLSRDLQAVNDGSIYNADINEREKELTEEKRKETLLELTEELFKKECILSEPMKRVALALVRSAQGLKFSYEDGAPTL